MRFSTVFIVLLFLLAAAFRSPAHAVKHEIDVLPPGRISEDWSQFKIFIWPYKTTLLRDHKLYTSLGIKSFQIDHGEGRADQVRFAAERGFVYYGGHIAGKGILHLTRENRDAVLFKRGLLARPFSLADPQVLAELHARIRRNVAVVSKGPVLAYALDDEVSLGSFNNPADVDVSPGALGFFRERLREEYGNIAALNTQWGANFSDFDNVAPQGYESLRKHLKRKPIKEWNMSAWMDFRRIMDLHFAKTLKGLVRFTNELHPGTPVGVAGMHAPGPWGGCDYALLCRSLQWMEAYDILGSLEILRSFWSDKKRPTMQTFFSTGDPKRDAWFLWRSLLHGNRGVVAWPEGWFTGGKIAPNIKALQKTFSEVQGPASAPLLDQDTVLDTDPIALYVSQASIRASWAMDALVHGSTWPKRLGSLDNDNQSKGLLRLAWLASLEDLGYQAKFISERDLLEDPSILQRFRVLVLPKTPCLSDLEAEAIRRYVSGGGTLVADYLCGIFDENGKARKVGALDDVFKIKRRKYLYLDGKERSEVDAELYRKPLLKRTSLLDRLPQYRGLPIPEGGFTALQGSKAEAQGRPVISSSRFGTGKALYLNLCPLPYIESSRRLGAFGQAWREVLEKSVFADGPQPRIKATSKGAKALMIETMLYSGKGKSYLALMKNTPGSDGLETHKSAGGAALEVADERVKVDLEFPTAVSLRDLLHKRAGSFGTRHSLSFLPWEALLFEVTDGPLQQNGRGNNE
jgi:hypothetical protein